jgi:hypothetical protein
MIILSAWWPCQLSLADNMDIRRLNELTEKDFKRLQKYHRAYKELVEYRKILAKQNNWFD